MEVSVIVRKLCFAAELLLSSYDYVGEGHEEIRAAQQAGYDYVDNVVEVESQSAERVLLKEIADWLGMDCEWATPEQAECLLVNTIDKFHSRARDLLSRERGIGERNPKAAS